MSEPQQALFSAWADLNTRKVLFVNHATDGRLPGIIKSWQTVSQRLSDSHSLSLSLWRVGHKCPERAFRALLGPWLKKRPSAGKCGSWYSISNDSPQHGKFHRTPLTSRSSGLRVVSLQLVIRLKPRRHGSKLKSCRLSVVRKVKLHALNWLRACETFWEQSPF